MLNVELVQYLKEQVESSLNSISKLNSQRIIDLSINISKCWKNGGKIAFVGNGGSAAEAMHLAAEFTGKCILDHNPLPAMCLNESQSAITAVGNDYGFEFIFSRQIEALLNDNDILICLSTSGKSKNIKNAMEVACNKKVSTYLWTGTNELNIPEVEIWYSNSHLTPRIQEEHLLWGHLLSEIIEIQLHEN